MTIALLFALHVFASSSAAAEPPKLSFTGQIRARVETTNIESYTTPLKRRGYDTTSLRTRLGAGVDAGQGVKGFIQFQDSRTLGFGGVSDGEHRQRGSPSRLRRRARSFRGAA